MMVILQKKFHRLIPGLFEPPVRTLRTTIRKGQILRSTPNTAPLICGACNTQPEGLLTMA